MKKPPILALVAYNGLRTFEYSIAADIFALDRRSIAANWYKTIVVSADKGPLVGAGGVRVVADTAFEKIASANTIVIPGWRDTDERPPERLLNALRAAAKRRARILSLCSGAFVLGAAGLLDGKRATTHWLFAEQFKSMFPSSQFESDVLYVDEGRIITSAGSAAGLDACLHLVRRDFGASIANTIARRMVVAPHREGGQAQYVEAPVSVRPGRNLGAAMDWALARLNKPIAIGDLADRSAMSQRTFLRHFVDAVGVTPNTWLQRERINRARELLEATSMHSGDIATQCGYESVETFRAAFRRIVGVAPAAYRARFARTSLRE